MEDQKQCSNRFSILMFPWIAHGHIHPYLELAKYLSSKNFNIFFCSTPINLTSIKDDNSDILENTSIQFVELHLPSLPDLPPHYHTTKNIPPNLKPKLYQAFKMSSSNFSDIITSLKPDLLIYDVFQSSWAAKIASSLCIPAVHFSVVAAVTNSFSQHNFRHRMNYTPFPYEGIHYKDHEIRALKKKDFSALTDENNDLESVFSHLELSREIVLINTCRAIEDKYIDYLSVLLQKKIIPVGPPVYKKLVQNDRSEKIIKWLSKKDPFSTVFISFGSENYLSHDQMEEIAKGLELCDVNFIWVVRFPLGERNTSLQEALPNGFPDRVKDRGLIVEGWAPQAEILAHESVGAFASHCGTNSTLESVYFGVPVVAIPLQLDQPLNARLLVEIGVGVEVERDEDGGFSGKDFADAVRKAVVEETGKDMRDRAEELSEKMRNEERGKVDEAAEELRRLCVEYKHQRVIT